jgi:leucyl aminopeptidase
MKVSLKKAAGSGNAGTLVVFASKGPKGPATAKLAKGLQSLLEAAQSEASFNGDKKESLFFRHANAEGYTNVLFVGLGDDVDAESFRVAAATAYGSLKAHKVTSVAVLGDSVLKAMRDSEAAIIGLTEGFILAPYDFNDLKNLTKKDKKEDKKPSLEEITVIFSGAPAGALQKAVERATILAEAQNFARWLGDNPGNYMTPTILGQEAQKAAKGVANLKVTVWDKARITKERMGGLLAVAQGSTQDPRFIVMEYNGGGKGKKPVVFVGKGLTFDSGGISIKPGQSMEEMKYDMCGGAAVIATLIAIAKLKLKVNVVGLVPSSENMPGPAALKPGDVYTARNGKTVEVFNTDAEGRLILGEALVYGSEQEPVAMFDAATLTGAILIALGNTHTGVFTRDAKLMKRVQDAADVSGELVWPMPLTDDHVSDMKGTHADLCNISNNRLAGSATAAAFLSEFVGEGVPWAHFDIAGTAWNVNSRFNYHPRKSASGIIVRTFVELAESF